MRKSIGKYLIISCFIILMLFLIPSALASYTHYPPAANWQQGANAGTHTESATDARIYLTVTNSGSYNYYVSTNPIDLRNVSQIVVDWNATWGISSNVGNVTFGISTNQMDTSFTARHSVTSAFSRVNTTLNTSSYYGDYYIKFGMNITNVVVLNQPNELYVYGITCYNRSWSSPTNATAVQSTSATLNGFLIDGLGTNITTCGFWYGKVTPVTQLNCDGNVSASGTYIPGQYFQKTVYTLTPGQYYYVRTWTTNGYTGFNVSSNESYFLTLPEAPTNLVVSRNTSTSLHLSWTNAAIPAGNINTTYIRYSETAPSGTPEPTTWGTFGANVSFPSDTTNISGLTKDTTYYFLAWTFTSDTGSPYLYAFSTGYASATNSTVGGSYNISIKYEDNPYDTANWTHSFVNLSMNTTTGIHRLYVYYSDTVEEVDFWNTAYPGSPMSYNSSTLILQASGAYGSNTDRRTGNFTIETTKAVRYFEFRYNDTAGLPFYCVRRIVPTQGQENVTFWIRTDAYVYQGFYGQSINLSCLVTYHYGFIDVTGMFRYPNNPQIIIYTFDELGRQMIIDSEYFDAEGKVHPWLMYGGAYYFGVKCDVLEITRAGALPTTEVLDHNELKIYPEEETVYSFYDLITLTKGWYDNGLYIHYQDTTSSTDVLELRIYYFYNLTNLYYASANGSNNYNFTFNLSQGCDFSNNFFWMINTTLTGATSEYYEGWYNATGYMFGNGTTHPTVTNSTLDYIFTIIFGDSPLFSDGSWGVPNGAFVPWTYIILFGACFIVLTTLGKSSAFLGGIGVGLVLILGGIVISGVQVLFQNYTWWQGASLITIGLFIMAISVIGLLGGVENQ